MPEPPRPDYLARIANTGDPLTPMDLEMCGGRSMQLRWTVQDQLDLRRIAAVLRGLANRLEIYSEPRRYDERAALLGARIERTQAQHQLMRPRKKA
jgi:uncharacterized small protein (DUF1192 family)